MENTGHARIGNHTHNETEKCQNEPKNNVTKIKIPKLECSYYKYQILSLDNHET